MASEDLQLLLPFPQDWTYDPRDFLPAESNRDALAWLDRMVDWPERRLALWGSAGCGKTHLLHLWARRTGAVRLSGQALRALEDLPPPEATVQAIALDDADTVVADITLLHLLNTARDRRLPVLLTARTPPSRWAARLPDLSSRLRAITAVEVGPPDDALLRALLFRLLAERQLVVPQGVQEWLLLRLPRTAAALREAVARLDRASLIYGKAITRALAARLLATSDAWQDDPEASADRVVVSQPLGLL
jgi:chromosomal replication initiation ATPase DnaA